MSGIWAAQTLSAPCQGAGPRGGAVSRRTSGALRGLLLVLGVALGSASAAVGCVGDCDGGGTVSVAELITGVRISLGDSPLSTCPAFEITPDDQVRIEELIMAVAAALNGCPATPTPQSTATVTPSPTVAVSPTTTATPVATDTPSPSDTPTATPTLPPVSGLWREDPLAIVASSCPTIVTVGFADDLASRPPCEQNVELVNETAVAVEDCTGTLVDGTLERDGTIRIAYPTASDTTEGCTVALTTTAVIPAAVSPTTVTYTFAVAFSGESCPIEDCTIEAQGTWTRL